MARVATRSAANRPRRAPRSVRNTTGRPRVTRPPSQSQCAQAESGPARRARPLTITVRASTGGSQNMEGPLTVEARALASESQYARIVQLVREAEASKSPLQRMADRYAVY
ncbi:MAG: hypothetical protein JNM53_11065, partial [Gemmatimonadetes bacterium]|nr:hypothetical protein [Gemmatimonadota bacterium]